jgi:hypothetical protein
MRGSEAAFSLCGEREVRHEVDRRRRAWCSSRLFVLFVVLPLRRAFIYFEDEDASGSDEYGI